jgi:hypothetical protein
MANTDPMPGIRRLQRLGTVIRTEGKAALRAAIVLEGVIKKMLNHPGTGRIYRSAAHRLGSRRKIMHQASAPGEPPAPDLGDLKRSIGHEVVNGKLRVGTGLKRAAALEFGYIYSNPHRVLKPRPFMRPSLAEAKKKMGEEVFSEIQVRGRQVIPG